MDSRTAPLSESMEQELGSKDFFRPITGLPISTYFSSYKLKWLIDNVPAVQKALHARKAYVGTMDTWLIWKLTGSTDGGQFVTDISNAARTNLMDIRTRHWHSETCKRFGLAADMLPEIRSNAEVFGHVKHGPLQVVQVCQ